MPWGRGDPWQGGLHWYKTLDADWHQTPQLSGEAARITVPAGFLAGSEDMVLRFYGGADHIRETLPALCVANVPPITIVEGAGHWIQQERPEETNAALLAFLGEHYPVRASRL